MGKNSRAQAAAEVRRRQMELKQKELEKKKRQNRITAIVIVSIVALVLIAVMIPVVVMLANQPEEEEETPETPSAPAPEMEDLDLSDKDISLFEETTDVTEYVKLNVSYTDSEGAKQTEEIIMRLFPEVAPISVANFQDLVKKGYYTGSTFHRIIESFMIQGGSGSGSLTPIKGEFSSNGVENNLAHIRGVVSMARANAMDSATSQFFIVHETNANNTASLDGKYAAFGYVVYGMDTVDAIATQETNSSDAPVNAVTINSATFVKEKSAA